MESQILHQLRQIVHGHSYDDEYTVAADAGIVGLHLNTHHADSALKTFKPGYIGHGITNPALAATKCTWT